MAKYKFEFYDVLRNCNCTEYVIAGNVDEAVEIFREYNDKCKAVIVEVSKIIERDFRKV